MRESLSVGDGLLGDKEGRGKKRDGIRIKKQRVRKKKLNRTDRALIDVVARGSWAEDPGWRLELFGGGLLDGLG